MPETTQEPKILNPMDALSAFVSTTQERVKTFDAPKDAPTDEPKVAPLEDPSAGFTKAATQHPATKPATASPDKTAAKDDQQPPEQPIEPPAAPGEQPRDKWPRSAVEWKKFTELRDKGYKERDERIVTLQKEIETLNAKTAEATTSKEIESLRKERDELSEKIAMLNVIEHPKFKAYYDDKRVQQIQIAKSILGERAAEFEQIMAMPEGRYKDEKLEEMVSDMGAISQGRLGAVLNNISAIEAERQQQIVNWKQNRDLLQAEEEKQRQGAEAQRQKTMKQLTDEFESELTRLQDKENGLPAFQKRGDAEWDAGVDKRIDYARALFQGKVDKQGAFRAITNAAAFDGVLQYSIALAKKNEELEQTIKSMQASNPTVKPGGTGAGAAEGLPELKEGMTPSQITGGFFERLRRQTGS